jgi:SAM-dependent methyltransferase
LTPKRSVVQRLAAAQGDDTALILHHTDRGFEVFKFFGRQKLADEPFARFSGLTDEAWFALLVRSIKEPVIDGIPMPRFPDDVLQTNTVGHAGEPTLREAFMFFSQVSKYARQVGRPLGGATRVLDFGCGWGRILRFFLRDCKAAHLQGIDVDPMLVDVCRSTFPYARFDTVNALPPTPFPEGSFDVITGYSVFSHLAEHASLAWVQEFSRLLRPGGLMVVTTQLRDFIAFCESFRGKDNEFGWHKGLANSFVDVEASYAAYDAGQYLYAPTGGGPARPSDFYGEAMIPEGYVRTRFTPFLRYVDFVADRNLLPQALIVMQKP